MLCMRAGFYSAVDALPMPFGQVRRGNLDSNRCEARGMVRFASRDPYFQLGVRELTRPEVFGRSFSFLQPLCY